MLTAPLITRDEPVGVIFFNYRDAPRAFTEAEMDFAQQLATTATIAMENARLFDEHRRAEQALREAHKQAEWLARFPQENPNPVLRVSADGRALYRNPAAMELPAWGCEVGKPLAESLQPLVARALAEKKQVHQDVQLDGTFYAVYVAPVPSEGYANIYGRDITDLWQAHERQEMAQRAAGAGIWDWNIATQSMEWSPEMFDLFGIESRLAGASFAAWESVLHPDDCEIAAARIQQALAEHTELNSEYRIVRPDGQVRWINARGRGAYDSSGRPVRMMGICIDITERKQAEEAIRKAREELEDRVRERTKELKKANDALQQAGAYNRSLIEASLDPLVTIGPDGQITDVNRATEEVTGRSRTELISTDFSGYFTEPERAREGYRTVFREGSVHDYPLEIRQASGRVTPVLYNATVYRDERGDVIGVFAAARDVTALRRAAAYNRSLIEASLDPLVTIGPDGQITDVNRATEEVTGRSRTELISTDFSGYFTEPERAREGYRTVFREGSVHDYPLEIRQASGRVTPVLYNATVYRDERGDVIGVFAAARDVTALRRAAAYNRSLIEASLDPLVTIGPDGQITDVNRATEEVTGRSRTELISTDFSDYFTEPEKAREGYRTVFREGSVRDYPLEIRHASGRATPVLYNATVYRDDGGQVVGVFAAARDVTERRRAEQVRAHLAAIVESSDDAIIGKDLNGTITSWNKGAERLYGYAAGEVVGKSISLLTPQENPDEIRQILDRVRRNESIAHFETIRVTKDSRPVHVSLMISPIRDACGQVVGVSTVARDVTEQRKTREAMEAERRRFNDVLDMLPAYVVLLAPDYHVPFANRFFRERFGDSGGKRCFEYLFHGAEPCENCESYIAMKTNAPYRWEWTGPDGRIYDIHDFPFADIDGSTLVLEMGIDITEQRRAERLLREHHDHLEKLVEERTKNLQEANERLRTQAQELQASNAVLCQREQALVRAKEHWERTFHSVPDLIAILDDQHHIVQANRAMAERLGMTPEQCIGLPCYRAVHCTNVPPTFCPHAQTLRDGREHAVETHEDHLGGDFLVSTTPLYDENGQMIGSVHVARDITEHKRAEEEVRRRMEELRIANEELTRFNRAMVNRELRMVELKKEINELCRQTGQAVRYQDDQ